MSVAETSLDRAVRGYLDHLAVERGLAANTLASYRRDLRRYSAFLDARDVTEPAAIGEGDVTAFLRSLREGDADHPPLGASSAARTVVAVRGLHRFLHREAMAPADAAGAVRPPTPPRRLPKAISLLGAEWIASQGWRVLGVTESPQAASQRRSSNRPGSIPSSGRALRQPNCCAVRLI